MHKYSKELSASDNIGLLKDVAESLRRVKKGDQYDDQGMRTLWHRGKLRSELMTWQHEDRGVTKQELTFFGMVVELKGDRIKTGAIPVDDNVDTDSGQARSHLLKMHASPSARILEHASELLKLVPNRDYYCQHLLKHVNETLASMQFDTDRTMVSSLAAFSGPKTGPVEPPSEPFPWKKWLWRGVGVAAMGLLVWGGFLATQAALRMAEPDYQMAPLQPRPDL